LKIRFVILSDSEESNRYAHRYALAYSKVSAIFQILRFAQYDKIKKAFPTYRQEGFLYLIDLSIISNQTYPGSSL